VGAQIAICVYVKSPSIQNAHEWYTVEQPRITSADIYNFISWYMTAPQTKSTNFPKLGVPKPVAGSHPSTALNPVLKHPGLLPPVISVIPSFPVEYSHGFKNPKTGFPCERRWSLRRAMTAATVGALTDVPPAGSVNPFMMTGVRRDCALMSGYPLPVLLEIPPAQLLLCMKWT
jgi:hypothetical protein